MGVQGENNARRVVFDTSNFRSSYGEGTAQVLFKPQGLNAYKVELTEEGETAYWVLKDTDTATDGYGELEFQWINKDGELLAKPVRYRTFTKKAIEYDESGRPPEHYVSWIDTLEKLAEKAGEGGHGAGTDGISPTVKVEQTETGAVITVKDAAGTTTATLTNGAKGDTGPQGPQGEKGDVGPQGPQGPQGEAGTDGTSPTAKVEQTETGAVITVKDATGTTTATLTNGAKGDTGAQGPKGEKGDIGPQGPQGAAGADGTSPTVKVEQTETGAVITVKDAEGTTTATLTNGAKGDVGPQGEKGDTGPQGPQGEAGTDGTSPTAKVEQTETGAVITVKDASGTTTATLTNGAKGDVGPQGPQGEKGDVGPQGPQGAKGDKGEAGASVSITGTTESTDDGGSNTVSFSDGTTLTVKNGKTGSAGTYTAGEGITISGGVISVSYSKAEEASV